MQLQVHLHQRLLQVLDVRGSVFCQTFALAHERTQGGDLRFRAETATEQAVGVQLAQPSRVVHIGFAAWHVLGVAGIHEDDLEAMRLQDLEGWYPVNAGRFHSPVFAPLFKPDAIAILTGRHALAVPMPRDTLMPSGPTAI